jgi:hypothetical protein
VARTVRLATEAAPDLSVVVPILNEERSVPELYRRTTEALAGFGRR